MRCRRIGNVRKPRIISQASCGDRIAPQVMNGPRNTSRMIFSLRAQRAGDDVAVAVEILRRRMRDHVDAERDRRLVQRRCVAVVAQRADAARTRQLRDRGQILQLERHRVRAFEHDQLRLRRQRALDVGDIGAVDEACASRRNGRADP